MSTRKNTDGQEFLVFAFDRGTLAPVLGDAANITAKLRLDGSSPVAISDTNPDEIEDGYYRFLPTKAETNADVIDILPESSTPGVQVVGVPARIFTSPATADLSLALALGSRALLETKFGEDNIAKWADLDNNNDPAEIDARITQALAFATEDMYDLLRGGPIAVPITGDPPLTLVDIVVSLAGVWLYENRGINDADKSKSGTHRLTYHRDRAYRLIREIRAGVRRISTETYKKTYPHYVDKDDTSVS